MANFEPNEVDLEAEWLPHEGGECPIPWAKAMEFEAKRVGYIFTVMNATELNWDRPGDRIIAYRLTDGWIPVVGGKCPIVAEAHAYEIKFRDGSIWTSKACSRPTSELNTNHEGCSNDLVAVRPIKQPSTLGEQVGHAKAQYDSWPAGKKKSVQIQGQDIFLEKQPPISEILDRSLLASSPKVAGGQLATKPSSDEIFEALTASAEAKKKARRDARTLRNVVPPIGMAEMIRIAGKAMED